MKKVVAILLAALLAIGACGVALGEETTLRVMWWGSQTRHDQTIQMLEMYMEQNPEIIIEYEYSGFDTYWDKLTAMAAASNLPDVWQNSVAYILSYVERDQLLDMNPYIESNAINLTDWEDVFKGLGVINGGTYGLTLGNSAYTVIYNPEILEQAGLEDPSFDWTWEDYHHYLKTIKETTDIYGDSQYAGGAILEGYQMYLRQNGYIGVVNETRDGLTCTDPTLWIEMFTAMKEQLDAGYVMPLDQAATMQSVEQTGIATGTAAMLGLVNSNQVIAAAKALGKDLKLAAYPHAEDEVQPGAFLGPTMFIGISKSTENPDESAKLVNFLLNDVEANKIALMEKGVPASAAVREGVAPLLSVTGQRVSEYVAKIAEIAVPYDNIYATNYSEMNDLYNLLVEDMMFGRISIENAANKFITEGDAILKG